MGWQRVQIENQNKRWEGCDKMPKGVKEVIASGGKIRL